MIGNDSTRSTAENFRRFALLEARGRSPLYEELATGVASDPEVLALLGPLSFAKRQPNLLLGAVRYLHGAVPDYASFRHTVVERWPEVRATLLSHMTQTNEVGRCATLLPLLAGLPAPLALLEVGASAGLCLLVDRYRYDYGSGVIGPATSPVTLHCDARGDTPVPSRIPEICWRAGIDIAPLDVRDEANVRWLEALVWPDEGDRLTRLRAAVDVARRDPPPVFRCDLRSDLSDVVADVPPDATLVIFHSAVLTYVAAAERQALGETARRIGAVWIANEGASVLEAPGRPLGRHEREEHEGHFLLSRDGRPVAWTDPHGAWVEWRHAGTDQARGGFAADTPQP